MKRINVLLATFCGIAGVVPATAYQDKKIREIDLPAAVRAAAKKESANATVKGYLTEVEHGVRVYEVETMISGHTRDLQFASDGTLNEIEEEVALDSLPKNVQDGLRQKAGKAKLVKVESLVKHGTLVAYEASTLLGAKHGEVQVGPKGETLTHSQ